MAVTIKDIAREVGLSVSAVSLVLNNKPCRISEKNKELIYRVAKERGYHVNNVARSLVTKKSNMVALIIPDIENMFFSSLAKVIEECCRAEGYVLLVANSNDYIEEDKNLLRQITARGVDGIFMIASNESYNNCTEVMEILEELPIPYVMVDRIYDNFECDKVYFDNEYGAYMATKYLLENGHRKIGCITNPDAYNGRMRLEGYLKAIKEYGCEKREEYIVKGDYKLTTGLKAAERLEQTDVTSVFACSDMIALGALKYFHSKGMKVPKDISLVSYDNAIAKYFLEKGLTSVEQNPYELSKQACEILFDKINKKCLAKREVALIPKIIIKDSVKSIG